ncbi:MAG TPA: TSUP family transporter [Hyphomicrobiaceae bacterium]|nr:TSUP family transporter [Hyphomicrobiaceae bacterium]
MLAPDVLALVAVAVVATSFISGMFGMAGGMLLLGLLLVFMDVAPAMVLFGIIQMAANGWRAVLWHRHVAWSIVWRFLVGSTAMFLLMRTIAILPSKAALYLGLGLIPFAAYALPRRWTPDITRPGAPYLCGAFIIVLQLLAGAAGHVLDIFFQKSALDRRTIVGTKAVTQVMGHVYRIAYFGSFEVAFDTRIPVWEYLGAIVLAFAGTSLAGLVLVRMTETGFRLWSRRLTIGVALSYLLRGLWLVAAP